MKRLLITSDLHLDDDPRHEYRWEVLPWLASQARRRRVDAVLVLGDLTDRKDHHSSVLVNRVVRELSSLATVAPVHLLKGNHDYSDPEHPFFGFLSWFDRVHYHSHVRPLEIGGRVVLFLPHDRAARANWAGIGFESPALRPDLVVCHQTFKGALASNDQRLLGLPSDYLETVGYVGPVVSGDVHVPQRLRRITYCGSPHPVRIGDTFRPRVLLWDDGRLRSIRRRTIRRLRLDLRTPADLRTAVREGELRRGDHARVRLHLRRRDFPDWPDARARIRQDAAEAGIVLVGCELVERRSRRVRPDRAPSGAARDPGELLRAFCRARDLPKHVRSAGRRLSEGSPS